MAEIPLGLARLAAAKMDVRLSIAGEVGKLIEKVISEGKINQTRIAERLGISKARVSVMLTSPGNWTMDTVGKLLAAVDYRVSSVVLSPIGMRSPRNARHDWLEEDFDVTVLTPYKPLDHEYSEELYEDA